jgi:hypothetical protein
MKHRHVVTAAAFALAVSSFALRVPPAGAYTATTEGARHINVLVCEPTKSVTTSGPAMYGPGFYPGYYPRSRYWDDVYGYPYYQGPVAVNETGSLRIDYKNVTKFTMQTIDFGLIANGRLVAEVRDVGKFSPNIEIKHTFSLNPNVFPLGTALPQCVPLRITYEDQATWVNPHLPALQRALYGP